MRILVCIDDTDNLESRGTGELASDLADFIGKSGWGTPSYVTRHQLLVHPDIPYTSHNSSMAFFAELKTNCLERFIRHARDFLTDESAEGSDPGLCVVVTENLRSPERLVAFGARAKQVVLTKEDAVSLARSLDIHLSEHGGTGQGIVGALAGAGLRLGGNDGRLRGRLNIAVEDGFVSVAGLLDHPHIDSVRCENGGGPAAGDRVRLGDKVKTVLLEGKSVLLVEQDGQNPGRGHWQNLSRRALKGY